MEIPYNSDGKRNGLVKTYYESGQLKEEAPYTSGLVNGIRKMYNESGQLDKTIKYVNGKEVE